MKKLFLLILFFLPISIFSMDDDKGQDGALVAFPEPLSEQLRKQYGAEAKKLAADIVGSSFSSVKIDENKMMEQMRQQQALIAAKSAEMSKDDPSDDLYARILGENFDLIQDDMPVEELDRRIAQLWNQEGEGIKREALTSFERVSNANTFQEIIQLQFGAMELSDEQIASQLRMMRNVVRESIESTHTSSMLKMRIDTMRKVFAVHKACLARKAQANSSSSSSSHHTIQ